MLAQKRELALQRCLTLSRLAQQAVASEAVDVAAISMGSYPALACCPFNKANAVIQRNIAGLRKGAKDSIP